MALVNRLLRPAKPDNFAKLMVDRLRQAGVEGPIEYDADEFRLVITSQGGRSIFLSNAYGEYCAVPVRGRKRVIQNYVGYGREPPPTPPDRFDDAKPGLLPCVRDRFYYEVLWLQCKISGATMSAFPTRPLAGHLAVELAFGFPQTVMTVTQEKLDGWGVGFEEALAVAKENLRKRSSKPFCTPAPGLYISPWRDNRDSSRLLLHDLIRQLEVNGDHVAMIPHGNLLIVTGSENPDGLRKMACITTEASKEPRAPSGIPICLKGNTWQTFVPSSDHPAYAELKDLRVQTISNEYARQQGLLNALYQHAGEEVFVASVTVGKDEDTGVLSTCSTWTKGVDTLLPRTDLIGFAIRGETGAETVFWKAAWRDVRAVVGDLMEPAGMYPERYRVREFPTPDQLSELAPLA